MNKLKTSYIIFLLILFITLGIIIVLPEVIPSFEWLQAIIIGSIYLIIMLLVYILLIRLWAYLQNVFDKTRAIILTLISATVATLGLLFSFIFTSLGVGQGYMGGTFYKELYFPQDKVTLYLYDDSFLEPLTTVKIKNKKWPFMKDIFFIENCYPSEIVSFRHNDSLEMSGKDIVVKMNLKTKKVKKINIRKE